MAGIVNLSGIVVTFLAPKPDPDLSAAPHGAWFAGFLPVKRVRMKSPGGVLSGPRPAGCARAAAGAAARAIGAAQRLHF